MIAWTWHDEFIATGTVEVTLRSGRGVTLRLRVDGRGGVWHADVAYFFTWCSIWDSDGFATRAEADAQAEAYAAAAVEQRSLEPVRRMVA